MSLLRIIDHHNDYPKLQSVSLRLACTDKKETEANYTSFLFVITVVCMQQTNNLGNRKLLLHNFHFFLVRIHKHNYGVLYSIRTTSPCRYPLATIKASNFDETLKYNCGAFQVANSYNARFRANSAIIDTKFNVAIIDTKFNVAFDKVHVHTWCSPFY